MKPSEFLGYCARSCDAGLLILPKLAPKGWSAYIAMTLPQSGDEPSPRELADTRVMRFLLAAEVAKEAGE